MPAWDKVLKSMAPEAMEAFQTIAPEMRQFVVETLPKVGERWVPVFNVFKEKFPASEWTKVEQFIHPLAIALRSQRTGQNIRKAGREVGLEAMMDKDQMSLPLREAQAAAKQGKVLDFVKPELAGSTSNIEYQANIKNIQELVQENKTLGNTKAVEELNEKLQSSFGALVKGQKLIKDAPWHLRINPFASPTTWAEYNLGNGAFVADHTAAMAAADSNAKMQRTWWRSLTQHLSSGGFKNMGQDKGFQKDMANLLVDTWPWQKRYYRMASLMEQQVQRRATLAAKGGDTTMIDKRIAALRPKMVDTLTQLNLRRYPAFKKYFDQPDVRIALYREPETRAWVEGLMQPWEKEVAAKHKGLMDNARAYAENLGIPVLNRDKEYVTHQVSSLLRLADKHLPQKEVSYVQKFLPRLLKFKERNPGSLQFFPSIHASTEAYITHASRKFGLQEFLHKWQDLVSGTGPLRHWPHLRNYIDKYVRKDIEKSMDDQWWDRALRQVTAWTYLTKTGLSAAVAFKHSLKFLGHIAKHPVATAQAVPPTIKGGLQLMFQRWGVTPGAEARMMRQFMASRNFYESFSGMTHPIGGGMEATTRLLSSTPVNWIEAFERGIAVMAGLNKAAGKGLSYRQTHRAVWQTILDGSFMGKSDNFLWLNKPWQQFMAIFAYSPAKVVDRSIRWGLKTLPEEYITGMKHGVLETAWRAPRDAYGTPYVRTMINFLTALGAAEGLGQAAGMEPWWIAKLGAAHIPLTRHTALGTEISPTIPVDLWMTERKRGGEIEDWASTLYDFFTATPALDRMKAHWRGELSKSSGGSPWAHHLGLPMAEPMEEMARKFEKYKGRSFGHDWERKRADQLRGKRLFGPIYEEGVKPWLRR